MPEYLAPAVYIEEIDTGPKPIEGVSTSTAGLIGVAERGPVGVPILVTSWGEYRRWFGETLSADLYGDHRFLPHAVEGFFTNAGRRVYVTRVLALDAASNAGTRLFRHQSDGAGVVLLTRSAAGVASVAFVETGAPLAVVANDWVRIGSGSEAQYPASERSSWPSQPRNHRRQCVSANHPKGATVDHHAALPALHVARKLAGRHLAGSLSLELTGAAATSSDDHLLHLAVTGPPLTNEELIYIRKESNLGGTSWRVDLETPLQFDHEDAEDARILDPLAVVSTTTLDRATVSGDSILVAVSAAAFGTAGHLVRIVEGTRGEVRRVGQVRNLTLGTPIARLVPAGASVQRATTADSAAVLADGGTVRTLTEQTTVGALAFAVDDRQGLLPGELLRVGAASDPNVDYVVIRDLPGRLPKGVVDPGRIVVATPLMRPHGGATPPTMQVVHLQKSPAVQAQAATFVHPATPGSESVRLTAALLAGAPTVADLARISLGSSEFLFVRIAADTAAVLHELALKTPLLFPHSAPQPILVREELLDVVALDPGVWGNRLRVSARREPTPLVRSRIRSDPSGIQDPQHIRLDSAAGVEPGTILSLADATGAPVDTPFKVDAIDRQNGYLLTLNTPLPGTAALGSSITSLEFAVGVYLLRQPDPGQPIKNTQILDSEIFRHLSLDPRHSRYVHRVIGTTWTPGAAGDVDDDGRPLRRGDRRSEGESAYIRVRDIVQDDPPGPAKDAKLPEHPAWPRISRGYAARRPPRAGAPRPRRRRRSDGALTDADYVGVDDANPERRTGLNSLQNIEEISIVACPGTRRACRCRAR